MPSRLRKPILTTENRDHIAKAKVQAAVGVKVPHDQGQKLIVPVRVDPISSLESISEDYVDE